ncbi:hypothetical protein [Aureispira sp. CCB-QB1]|uniref:hypothetical protein n=1 Tax=Aureispira sp. CCB-QB1 TaxID=1313421 RepID=UPI0006966A0F|nr:hypothetical protein [Aureispira sp. CCB-QB1]
MKPILYYAFFSILIFSCSIESEKSESKNQPTVRERVQLDTLDNSNNVKKEESKLKEKAEKLYQSKKRYRIKSLDSLNVFKTRLFSRLEKLHLSNKIDKDSLLEIVDNISEAREVFVKSELPVKYRYRAKIAEYIFTNTTNAKKAFKFIKELSQNKKIWVLVSYEPYAFFLEGKKLYYINTGGEYMRGGEKEIKLLMMEQ